MSDIERITVLLSRKEAVRLNQYCESQGFKKSTLIARLIKEHLDTAAIPSQQELSLPILEHQQK
jgi:hypothetical protein